MCATFLDHYVGSVGLNLGPCACKASSLWTQFSLNTEVPDAYQRQAGPWFMKVIAGRIYIEPR